LPRYSSVPFTRLRAKGGVYQFRYQLPVDVAAHVVGSFARTVIFSLGSRDPLVARSRALRAAADIGDIIAAVRAGRPIPHWPLDPARYQRDHLQSSDDASLDRHGRSLHGADHRSPERLPQRRRASPDRLRASHDDLPERLQPSQDRPARERRGKRQAQRGGRASKGMTLLTVYNEVYLPRREERKGAPPRRRSRLDMELSIKRFVELAGNKDITEITKKDAEQFVRGLEVGSVATKRKAITCLSTICNSAVAADLILHNPFRGLGPDRASVVAARRSYQRFDMEQLQRIFARTEREDGAVLWLPRLLLLTGARLEEMAQIRAEWFTRRDGVDVIDLHDARVKSPHNRRFVPLHHQLLNLGVVDFAARASDRIFPELN
jgi:hypothetical protein